MKRLSITIVILFTVFTMACKKSSDISTSGGPRTNSGTTQSAPARSQSSETAPVFEENIPEAMPPYAAPQPIAAAGLNPPHGQPNHRCDIAVGVPLDSPPGTRPTPPVASQLNVPAQTTTPSTTPGMNPPHGQPDHRCDIAVGAPLDSPPAKSK
jgi:hypothetical protein